MASGSYFHSDRCLRCIDRATLGGRGGGGGGGGGGRRAGCQCSLLIIGRSVALLQPQATQAVCQSMDYRSFSSAAPAPSDLSDLSVYGLSVVQ